MSLKHTIVKMVMFGAPLLLTGCLPKGRVVAKADHKMVITNLKNPTDTMVMKFTPYANGYEYYDYINVGDTVVLNVSGWNQIIDVYCPELGAHGICIKNINGRPLSFWIDQRQRSATIRQIMEKSQSR